MIKKAIARLMQGLRSPTEQEHAYIDFDATLDLISSTCPRDVVGQAVCATAMLRRAVTWCEHLGGDKDQIMGFVKHALDGCPDCNISHAKEIWSDLDTKLSAPKERFQRA